MRSDDKGLKALLKPASIAVVGASDNPEKIGGRPIKYMLQHGYRGRLYPVNPARPQVQGLKSYADIASLPEPVELAIVAVPGAAAVQAVADCAAHGVRAAIVMSSGFGETGDAGRRMQGEMVRLGRAAGMRIVGPNTQGTVNFGTGAIASFATMIGEVEPKDGPVAIVSQSGAMSMVPYAFLRGRGIGVRHSHATGNECDLTVADFAHAVALDPDVGLILLYLEAIADPEGLEQAALVARGRNIPIVALKAGVSERGQAAASSHTGALATEDRIVDAFFEKLGIWRAPDMRALCNATDLYLRGWKPTGRRIVAVSNSGASCVMAADAAERFGADLAPLDEETQSELKKVLPGFAAVSNPVDLTAALLTDSSLFGSVLPLVAGSGDAFFISLPMSGKGYDVPRFARDASQFARRTGKPVVLSSPLRATCEAFKAEGVIAFDHDVDAMSALAQYLRHEELRARQPVPPMQESPVALPAGSGFLSEAESLELLQRHRIPVVPYRVCSNVQSAQEAFDALGAPVVVKGCAREVPHKSEHGLVALGVADGARTGELARQMLGKLKELNAAQPSVIVARMLRPARELVVGARWMDGYGAVLMVGDGGKYVEALGDVAFLVFPFAECEVREKLEGLRVAPLLRGLRGDPPINLDAVCRLAVSLSALVSSAGGRIASVDLNPVFVGPDESDTVVVDALVEL